MKGLVKLVVFAAVVVIGARYAAEWKAEAMVDVAGSMTRDGRYEEALQQLDTVQSWFSWTQAAERIETERKLVRKEMGERREQKAWDRRLQELDRKREREEASRRLQERNESLAEAARERSRPVGSN